MNLITRPLVDGGTIQSRIKFNKMFNKNYKDISSLIQSIRATFQMNRCSKSGKEKAKEDKTIVFLAKVGKVLKMLLSIVKTISALIKIFETLF